MRRVIFTGGSLYHGSTDPPVPGSLAVEDGRIAEVGATAGPGDEVVDCTGCTVLPGLIDCHVHVMVNALDLAARVSQPFSYRYYAAAAHLRALLNCGITTARDAAGADLGVKQALADGLITGPQLLIALSMLSQTGGASDSWHASDMNVPLYVRAPGVPGGIADGPDEIRRRVRELARAGADVIKLATSGSVTAARDDPAQTHFDMDEITAAVQAASGAGLPVMAHAHSAQGIANAAAAGVRSVEHGSFIDSRALDLMLEHGTWLVPTLSAPLSLIEPDEMIPVRLSTRIRDQARRVADAHRESVAKAVAAGVRIAMGTDAIGWAPGRNLDELQLMVQAGMTPLAALHAATGSAAELLGMAGVIGTLSPRARADLVVVAGDLADVAGLRARLRSVWQGGTQVA